MLDSDAILSAINAINARLPRQVRWTIRGTPMDFDFAAERYGLRRLVDGDLLGGIPAEWADCRLIGMYDYAEGGGASPWIAIRESDGFVCGLDIEREGEITFVFNSSLDRFIETFALLDPYLRAGKDFPPGFVSQASALDPDVFPVSDWRNLIEFLTTD